MAEPLQKDQAHEMVDRMPEGSTWEDLIREIYVRQVIERQSELLIEQASDRSMAAQAAKTASANHEQATPTTAARTGAADPVIGSIMAQFEMLQKDRMKRRGKA